jgi:hypothetical protein
MSSGSTKSSKSSKSGKSGSTFGAGVSLKGMVGDRQILLAQALLTERRENPDMVVLARLGRVLVDEAREGAGKYNNKYIHIHIHTYTYIYIHIYIHTHTYTYIHSYIYTNTYTH